VTAPEQDIVEPVAGESHHFRDSLVRVFKYAVMPWKEWKSL
jgi:hypothetical protein